MKVVKKINNNVAQCIDSNGKELIAFGRGIGFPAMPYELTDLKQISMTFYRLDRRYYELLGDIPEEIFEISAHLVEQAQKVLKCNLNPNLVVSLADHINFALVRLTKFKTLKMAFADDVEVLYPRETELGRYAVMLIQKKLLKSLPKSEVTNIAMHFVTAQEENNEKARGTEVENMIDQVMGLVERNLNITVERDTFQYNRFVYHFRRYVKRLMDGEQVEDGNERLINNIIIEYPDVYACALEIAQMTKEQYQTETTSSELSYLIIYLNGMRSKTIKK